MNPAPRPQPLLVELTSETLSDLPMSTRLLWTILSSHPTATEPTRLNLKRIKAAAFPFDAEVTVSVLEEGVLELEDRGLLETHAAPDGRERYRILTRTTTASARAESAPTWETQLAPSRHIASVERESEREREQESERAPRRPTPRTSLTPPARYCADHTPLGPGREPCVLCEQARIAAKTWVLLVSKGITPPADLSVPPIDTYADRRPEPHPTLFDDAPPRSPDPSGRRRPRFDVVDPEDPWPYSLDDLPTFD